MLPADHFRSCHVFAIIKHLCTILGETEMNMFSLLCSQPKAGCKSNETDSDEIISAAFLLMTTANISYKPHRRRCVMQKQRFVQFAK